jgi:hypothetical protein
MAANPNIDYTRTNLTDAYENVVNAFDILRSVRDSGLPEDVMRLIYIQLINRLNTFGELARADQQNYLYTSRLRAREERISRAANNAQPAQPAQPEQPAAQPEQPVVLPPLRHRKHKSRACSQAELAVQITDPCAICYEGYTKLNSVTTSCGHSFCKDCYTAHENTRNNQTAKAVVCPICRADNPQVTEYRARKTKQPTRAIQESAVSHDGL